MNARVDHPIWTCAECGVEKLGTAYQRRRKYCSSACKSAAYRQRLRGAGNPNFQGGRHSRRTTGRPWARVSSAHIQAVISWTEARDALGSADDLAVKLGLPKRSVHHIASNHRRKVNAPTVAIVRCAECRRIIQAGRFCEECARTAWVGELSGVSV